MEDLLESSKKKPFGVNKEHGQSMLEFALVLPILLFMTMAIFDFGRALFTYSEASNAVRNGLRYGAILGYDPANPAYAQCQAMIGIAKKVSFATPGQTDVDVDYLNGTDGLAKSTPLNCYEHQVGGSSSSYATKTEIVNGTAEGDIIRITYSGKVTMITPLFGRGGQLPIVYIGQRTLVKSVTLIDSCGIGGCQPGYGENCWSCARDCGPPEVGAIPPSCVVTNTNTNTNTNANDNTLYDCGDGVCNAPDETNDTCRDDCPVCPDGFCTGNNLGHEQGLDNTQPFYCFADCNNTNGTCDPGETSDSTATNYDPACKCGDEYCNPIDESYIPSAPNYCDEDCNTCGIDGNNDNVLCDPWETPLCADCTATSTNCGKRPIKCEPWLGEDPVTCPSDCTSNLKRVRPLRWNRTAAVCNALDSNQRQPGLSWRPVKSATFYLVWAKAPADTDLVLIGIETALICGKPQVGKPWPTCLNNIGSSTWWQTVVQSGDVVQYQVQGCNNAGCGPLSNIVKKKCK